MDKLNLKFREKRTLELTSGTTVVIKHDDGDSNGEPMYTVKLSGCTWAEIVAIGRALAPEDISAAEFARTVGEVEVVEPEEEDAS